LSSVLFNLLRISTHIAVEKVCVGLFQTLINFFMNSGLNDYTRGESDLQVDGTRALKRLKIYNYCSWAKMFSGQSQVVEICRQGLHKALNSVPI
jgi:hypothetical protein